jgi:hypothetical protein
VSALGDALTAALYHVAERDPLVGEDLRLLIEERQTYLAAGPKSPFVAAIDEIIDSTFLDAVRRPADPLQREQLEGVIAACREHYRGATESTGHGS